MSKNTNKAKKKTDLNLGTHSLIEKHKVGSLSRMINKEVLTQFIYNFI